MKFKSHKNKKIFKILNVIRLVISIIIVNSILDVYNPSHFWWLKLKFLCLFLKDINLHSIQQNLESKKYGSIFHSHSHHMTFNLHICISLVKIAVFFFDLRGIQNNIFHLFNVALNFYFIELNMNALHLKDIVIHPLRIYSAILQKLTKYVIEL